MEGPEIRVYQNLWRDLAYSEERAYLMKELLKLNVGFREIEDFNINLVTKLRSEKMRKSG